MSRHFIPILLWVDNTVDCLHHEQKKFNVVKSVYYFWVSDLFKYEGVRCWTGHFDMCGYEQDKRMWNKIAFFSWTFIFNAILQILTWWKKGPFSVCLFVIEFLSFLHKFFLIKKCPHQCAKLLLKIIVIVIMTTRTTVRETGECGLDMIFRSKLESG